MRAQRTSVVVVGAGPAGLATSACLAARGIDHVVFERGIVADAWRNDRWDSLRLLTPNWMTRLPGLEPARDDPDGFMPAADVAALLERYRHRAAGPVVEHAAVRRLEPTAFGFRVFTHRHALSCRSVVIATGPGGRPRIPPASVGLPTRLRQLPALRYRRPSQVGEGGVLVVGASASGLQIAEELLGAGRHVTIAVGDHVRLPRRYRGYDIYRWMDAVGLLDERHDQVPDLDRARRLPSAQLVGSPDRRTLDLQRLHAAGATVVGRFAGARGRRIQFSGGLANLVSAADLKQARLLDRIDRHIAEHGIAAAPPDRPEPISLPTPPTEIADAAFDTVVWATGHRQHHPWLDAAVLDRHGRIRHDAGRTPVDGLFAVGLPLLRTRRSSLLGGIGDDAAAVADLVRTHLGRGRSPARVQAQSA